ncbi:hypothetical protein [Nocardia sp. NPDC052566]|uniref:hypothetical protein n=1 Tax=Nocardia sp. NPDC052566 TaxID=3364330 RepID=UPI0037C80EC0
MTTGGSTSGRPKGLSLDIIHWHLTREDSQRTAISMRAGAILSTNALVVAGTALAQLERSLSLGPDDGIHENIGIPMLFENRTGL